MTTKPRGLLAAAVLGFMLAAAGCAGTPTSKSTGEVISDSTIATSVKAKMVGDPIIQSMDIQVETFKGAVQLSGFASSQDQIDRAVTLAANTKGVRSVKNDIRLK